jgi:predicted RecB family nuclease
MKPFNLKQMGARYGISVQTALENNGNHTPTNLLSIINGQVYFPTYSNSLKSIACWLGFEWSGTSLTSMALTNEERKSGHAISAFSSVARSVQWLAEAIGLTGID